MCIYGDSNTDCLSFLPSLCYTLRCISFIPIFAGLPSHSYILRKPSLFLIVRIIISSQQQKKRQNYCFMKYRLMSAIQITRKFYVAAVMSVLSPRFFVKYFSSRALQLESCNSNIAHYNLLMVGKNALFDISPRKKLLQEKVTLMK